MHSAQHLKHAKSTNWKLVLHWIHCSVLKELLGTLQTDGILFRSELIVVSRKSIPESTVPGLRYYYTSPFNAESDQVCYYKGHVHKTAASARVVEHADTCRLNTSDLRWTPKPTDQIWENSGRKMLGAASYKK